jgi:hypothetical protein
MRIYFGPPTSPLTGEFSKFLSYRNENYYLNDIALTSLTRRRLAS